MALARDNTSFSAPFLKDIEKFFILSSPNTEAWEEFIKEFLAIELPAHQKFGMLYAVVKNDVKSNAKFNHSRLMQLFARLLVAGCQLFDEQLIIQWMKKMKALLDKVTPEVKKELQAALKKLLTGVIGGIDSDTQLNVFVATVLPHVTWLDAVSICGDLFVAISNQIKKTKIADNDRLSLYLNECINDLIILESGEKELWDLLYWLIDALKEDKNRAGNIVKFLMIVSSWHCLGQRALQYQSTTIMYFKLLVQLEAHIDEAQFVSLLLLAAPWKKKSEKPRTSIFPFIMVAMLTDLKDADCLVARQKYLSKVLRSEPSFKLMLGGYFVGDKNDEDIDTKWEVYNGRKNYFGQTNLDLVMRRCDPAEFASWVNKALTKDVARVGGVVRLLPFTWLIRNTTCLERDNPYVQNFFQLVEFCLSLPDHRPAVVAAISHTEWARSRFFFCMVYDEGVDAGRLAGMTSLLLPTPSEQKQVVTEILETFRKNRHREYIKVNIPSIKEPQSNTEFLYLYNAADTVWRFANVLMAFHQAGIELQAIKSFLSREQKYGYKQYNPNSGYTFCQFLLHRVLDGKITMSDLSVVYDLVNLGIVAPEVNELAKFRTSSGQAYTPIHDLMLTYVGNLTAQDEQRRILEGIRDGSTPFGAWYWRRPGSGPLSLFAAKALPTQYAQHVQAELAKLPPLPVKQVEAEEKDVVNKGLS